MAASTAPSVKAALLRLLQSEPTLAGVGIDYSDPGAAILSEAIFYGRTIETERPVTTGRRQAEEYDIEVYIYVSLAGDDPQTCEERCWTLVAALENVVRANSGTSGALPAAGVPGTQVWMAGIQMTPFTYQGARVAESLCRVHVSARK